MAPNSQVEGAGGWLGLPLFENERKRPARTARAQATGRTEEAGHLAEVG